jgi:hypothetical protein
MAPRDLTLTENVVKIYALIQTLLLGTDIRELG